MNVKGVGESHKIVKQTDSGFGVDTQAGPGGEPLELSRMTSSWVGTPMLAPGTHT